MMNRIILIVSLLLSIPLAAAAATVDLPKTGQNLCYDAAGAAMDCAGTGQDGETRLGAAWPAPRFTDNGNGTVTDRLTGLIWLKDANCTLLNPAPNVDGVTWGAALTASNGLSSGQCGLTDGSVAGDWRLPNVNELESLIDLSQVGPPLPAGNPFTNVDFTSNNPNYWTSTYTPPFPTNAEGVHMYLGAVRGDVRTAGMHTWPVRGTSTTVPKTGQNSCWDLAGQPAACAGNGSDGDKKAGVAWPNPRFADNGDGTLTDQLTGLIWVKKADCFGVTDHTWQEALAGTAALASGTCGLTDSSLAGDWRLPNRNEMRSLVNYQEPDGGTWLASQGFTGAISGWYWTSDSYPTSGFATSKWLVKTEGGTWLLPDVLQITPAVPKLFMAVRGALKVQRITFNTNTLIFGNPVVDLSTTATGGGSGNPLTFTLVSGPATLNGTNLTLTGPGTVVVEASQAGNGTYYPAAPTQQSFTVRQAAVVTLTPASLNQTYDGTPKTAAATTTPNGLTVAFTYAGGTTAPTDAGSYPVIATINDLTYGGTASGTLVIAKGTATVTITPESLAQSYDGTAKTCLATTTPAGRTVTFTYAGSATAPTSAGSYPVEATVSDPNYTGSATGTLVVAKGTPTISWTAPQPIDQGTPLSATQLNATSAVDGTFAYSPALGTVPAAGTVTLTCTFTPTDTANYGTATAERQLTVNLVGFTVTGTVQGNNGTISCTSPVASGGNGVCTITPAAGYHLISLTDNGVDRLAAVSANSYTIAAIAENHTVTVSFARPDGIANNADGKTRPDINDAVSVLQIVRGARASSAADVARCDVAPLGTDGTPGGDGALDIYDVIGILRMVIGQL